MKNLKIELPKLHTAQCQVVAEARRFNVVDCGRRWGKTVLGIDRIIEPALNGFPVAWFAPVFKNLLESYRALQAVLAPAIAARNNSEYRLELRTGGSITMFSLDGDVSDSVRGRAFKTVVVDEAAIVRNLRQIWESTIRPTLADHRGAAWFLSTPRGFGDFKVLFDRGQDPEREDWASWQMPTAGNPHIAPEEIEDARQDMAEAAFNQEFLAQFVSWEGSVFRNVLECATAERSPGPVAGHEYVFGVDWGRSADFTVFAVVDVTTRAMVDMDRSNRVDYVVQRGRLAALYERWRPSQIIAESNSIGQPIIEQLQRDGLPVKAFTTTNSSKAAIIEGLALAFEQRSIAILNDPILLGELQAFAAEQLPGGMLRYSAPSGAHDDAVMALAIAFSVVSRNRMSYGLLAYMEQMHATHGSGPGTWVDGWGAEGARLEAMRQSAARLNPDREDKAVPPAGCPQCGASCIQAACTGGHRCGACGHQWNAPARSRATQRRGGF